MDALLFDKKMRAKKQLQLFLKHVAQSRFKQP